MAGHIDKRDKLAAIMPLAEWHGGKNATNSLFASTKVSKQFVVKCQEISRKTCTFITRIKHETSKPASDLSPCEDGNRSHLKESTASYSSRKKN